MKTDEITMQLLKPDVGRRLLRLEHAPSGVCLEKSLDVSLPIVAQTQRWQRVFAGLIESESLAA